MPCRMPPALGATRKNPDDGRAALADGETVNRERCLEPEVVDLAVLLVAMGGECMAPAPDECTIVLASKALHGADYAGDPRSHRSGHAWLPGCCDQPARADALAAIAPTMLSAGDHQLEDAGLFVHGNSPQPASIQSQATCRPVEPSAPNPFPGSPTDLQAPFMSPVGHDPWHQPWGWRHLSRTRLQHVAELQRNWGPTFVSNGNTVPWLKGRCPAQRSVQ